MLDMASIMAPISTFTTHLTPHVPRLLTPLHPYFPIAPLDLVGAIRLCSVVDWMARGVFDPPASSAAIPPPSTSEAVDDGVLNGVISEKKSGTKKAKSKGKAKLRARATLLQELFGLMVVVFGPETFLSMMTGSPPSWLISAKIPLLFCLTHTLLTRTSLRRFLPKSPSLPLELLMAIPDAIGRTLLLTQFSILPILHPSPNTKTLPATTPSLLLTPFIVAVPFAALIFTGTNFFSPNPTFTTPAELRPGGWMAADAWVPVVIPVLFLSLIGPVPGWAYGFGWDEGEAVVACMIVCSGVFLGRAIYNFGYKKEQWAKMLGVAGERRKIKTA